MRPPLYHRPKALNQIPWIYTEGISDGKQVFGCQVASLCLAELHALDLPHVYTGSGCKLTLPHAICSSSPLQFCNFVVVAV